MDLRKAVQGAASLATLPTTVSGDSTRLGRAQTTSSTHTSQPLTQADGERAKPVAQAQNWLLEVLNCHESLLNREQELKMFRRAVQKDMLGRRSQWTELEQLYMALSDHTISSIKERYKAGLKLVLRLDFMDRLKNVSKYAAEHRERQQRALDLKMNAPQTYGKIAARSRAIVVDHFACAIPLSQLRPSTGASVVDDNVGCCPICQNSYTAITTFSVQDLLDDYPVRIKHCGHIIGKACLERWMMTPKIDEAKYPHRTCPMCRVKIEGVENPKIPDIIKRHVHNNQKAKETARALLQGWYLQPEDSFEGILALMSKDIACEEFIAEIQRKQIEDNDHTLDKELKVLNTTIEGLSKEKWAWGFRGDAIWRKMRAEWMDVGVVRQE
jgi:hypothetical protein